MPRRGTKADPCIICGRGFERDGEPVSETADTVGEYIWARVICLGCKRHLGGAELKKKRSRTA